MYRTLLFDVDDTLLDFKAGELKSLAAAFEQLHVPYSPEIETQYLNLNAGLWEQYEAGTLTRPQLFDQRFDRLFKKIRVTADPHQMERTYHKLLDQQAIVGKHVRDTLSQLTDYRMYVVSNGIEPIQLQRLTQSGLIDYFDDVFVSDSVGAPKPTIAFFDYVAKRIPRYDPKETLIIGDSLTSDIQGGINGKIDTAWFNPTFVANRKQITPTYTLTDFSELPQLLVRQ